MSRYGNEAWRPAGALNAGVSGDRNRQPPMAVAKRQFSPARRRQQRVLLIGTNDSRIRPLAGSHRRRHFAPTSTNCSSIFRTRGCSCSACCRGKASPTAPLRVEATKVNRSDPPTAPTASMSFYADIGDVLLDGQWTVDHSDLARCAALHRGARFMRSSPLVSTRELDRLAAARRGRSNLSCLAITCYLAAVLREPVRQRRGPFSGCCSMVGRVFLPQIALVLCCAPRPGPLAGKSLTAFVMVVDH